MAKSGTIKTLAALVAALTVGTWALIWMETSRATPTFDPGQLAATTRDRVPSEVPESVLKTDVAFQPARWRNIIIHDSIHDRGRDVAGNCHFVIGSGERGYEDGQIVATNRWKGQTRGQHIFVPGYSFNDTSVGICLLYGPGRDRPTSEQYRSLIRLVRTLQNRCRVPRDMVYLHSELAGPQARCPGSQFPADFREELEAKAQ